MKRHRDDLTMDLLTWEPPSIVPHFEPAQVRAPTFREQLSRAVALTLSESDIPRGEIAKRMAKWMGEDFSLQMLNAYASQAKNDHIVSANRLAALCAVTHDVRPLQLIAEKLGMAIVPERYVAAIEFAELTDKEAEIAARKKLARGRWKKSR